MPMHLQDLVGQHPYLFWLLLAPLFGAAEALLAGRSGHRRVAPGRWVLVMPACVLGGVVAAVAPALAWLHVLVVVVAALVLQRLLRPRLFPASSR